MQNKAHRLSLCYYLCCFLATCIVFVAASALCGLYPLGPEMFVISDARLQYIDFFAWYKDIFRGDANVFYMATQGMGSASIGLFSYYLASPVNLLALLFDEHHLSIFFFVMTVVKVGFIQATTTFYLRRRFQTPPIWACALALGFTLCVWVLTQARNPMWLDALALLPLSAWGVCCLLRDGRWRLLVLSAAATVITCWYMAYIIFLFLCLYAVFEGYALGFEDVLSSGRTHTRRLIACFACLMGALALAAFLFVPTVLAMMGGGAVGESLVSKTFGFLEARGISMPVALGGALVCIIALGCLLVLLRRYSLRRKLAVLLAIALALCLAASFVIPNFQAMSVPAMLEALFLGTWADCVNPQLYGSALILVLAIVFFALRCIPLKLKLACALMLALLALSSILLPLEVIWSGMRVPSGFWSRMSFLFTFMLLWIAAFSLRALMSNRDKLGCFLERRLVAWTALALTAAELIIRCCLLWPTLYTDGLQEHFDSYMDMAYQQAAELEARDPGIYRVEKTYMRMSVLSGNEGISTNVNQISSYSSTTESQVIDFLTRLGYGNGEFYTFDTNPSLVGETLLGVKYVGSTSAPLGFDDAGFLVTPDGQRFYENQYPLSLGYGASPDVLTLALPEDDRWSALNQFASAVAGQELNLFSIATNEKPPLDMNAFEAFYGRVSEHQMAFDSFAPGHIEGTFDAAEGQLLLLTVPNQNGWHVTVNGSKVEPLDVAAGALMAIPVTAGSNQIQMDFQAPGLTLGCLITLSSVVALVVLWRKRIP